MDTDTLTPPRDATLPRPRRAQGPMDLSLSVFFPFFNEEGNIEALTFRAVGVLERLVRRWEIILVDDGSRDRTGEIADRLVSRDGRIRVVHHGRNRGYGMALRSGFAAATMDYVFFTDGDGQFDLADISGLLEALAEADAVCGIRRHRRDNLVRKINAACWSALVQKVLRFRCPDVDCAFKLFRRDVVQGMALQSTGALISAEILSRAARAGHRIRYLPVRHLPRTSGRATGAKPGVIFKAFKELWRLRKGILDSEA